ncbi:MAG: tetratricopeptide repeat protein [Lachnospiraceae bacterium]
MEKPETNTDFEMGKDNVEKVIARKKNKIALIIGIILVVLIVAVVSVVAFGGNSKRKLARQLDLAESYVQNLDYKAAIAEYKAAIELDSKCVDAYVGLAEVYVEMEEYEAAIKVLEDGYEETEQTTIKDMLGDVEKLLEEVQEAEESEEQENETEDFSEEKTSDSPVEENESADNSGAGKVTQGIELIFTDGTTALALFEEAADMGNEDAMFLAGYMLDWGRCNSGLGGCR